MRHVPHARASRECALVVGARRGKQGDDGTPDYERHLLREQLCVMKTSRFLAGLFWFLAGSEGLLSCIRSLQQNPLGSEDFFCSFFSRFHVE